MSDWIRVDNSKVRQIQTPEIDQSQDGGTVVRLFMSPHAVPIALRGRSIEEDGEHRLLIEFRYLDEDDDGIVKLTVDGDVEFRYGKTSQRLLSINLPDRLLQTDTVQLNMKIGDAAQQLREKVKGLHKNFFQDNLRSTQSAVDQAGRRLFGDDLDSCKLATM